MELSLNTEAPLVVIDARVWAQPNPTLPQAAVTVSLTGSAIGAVDIPWVTDATVVIWDDSTQRDTLRYYPFSTIEATLPKGLPLVAGFDWALLPAHAGAYVSHTLRAIPGRTYFIGVQLPSGQEFRAQSHLPHPVAIDSVWAAWQPATPRQPAGHSVAFRYTDPPQQGNRYLCLHYLNGVLQNYPAAIDVFADNLASDAAITHRLDNVFHVGDTLRVEFHTLTPEAHAYWRGFRQLLDRTQGPFDAPGANPPSNFSGGALGLFWCSAPQRAVQVVNP
jgi:hypothetical protein